MAFVDCQRCAALGLTPSHLQNGMLRADSKLYMKGLLRAVLGSLDASEGETWIVIAAGMSHTCRRRITWSSFPAESNNWPWRCGRLTNALTGPLWIAVLLTT